MKIAVIDQITNPGGGARVVRALLPAMKKQRPDLDITFFANPHGIRRENLNEVAESHQIKIVPLSSTKIAGKDYFNIRGSRQVIKLVQSKCNKLRPLLPVTLSGAIHQELEQKVKGFDVAFFSWPFHLECPDLQCPMVGTFHDFNYKYYFSSQCNSTWTLEGLNRNVPLLMARSIPIVSTQFMFEELQKFYPQHAHKAKVIPIAPMSKAGAVNIAKGTKILEKLNIRNRYLLYPTNIVSHKNIGPLLAAQAILRRRGHDISLILVGNGTEGINGKSCAEGIEICREGQDVFGLGYVSNDEVDALIQGAAVSVNASLYEANNGPGFDSWALGTPVAMSNIPPFLEHIKVHDVKAAVFNPRIPEDIADKIEQLLLNSEQAQQDAIYSQISMQKFTWEKTAGQYLQVFDEAIRQKQSCPL